MTPLASSTGPSPSPVITAASLAPLMVMSIDLLGAVSRRHRDQFCSVRARRVERLNLRVVVVERVGPGTRGVDRERAIGLGNAGLHNKGRRAVHVGGMSRQGGASPAVPFNTPLASSTARRRAGDHRRVVGAVDGDGDDLRVPSAVFTVMLSV